MSPCSWHLAVPLLLSIGLASDYARGVAARSHIQELADLAALYLAASGEKDHDKLEVLAEKSVSSNQSPGIVDSVSITKLETSDKSIDILLRAQITTNFMSLAGIDSVGVQASALAERAVTGSVEVVLVLDNTWSMSAPGSTGLPEDHDPQDSRLRTGHGTARERAGFGPDRPRPLRRLCECRHEVPGR